MDMSIVIALHALLICVSFCRQSMQMHQSLLDSGQEQHGQHHNVQHAASSHPPAALPAVAKDLETTNASGSAAASDGIGLEHADVIPSEPRKPPGGPLEFHTG